MPRTTYCTKYSCVSPRVPVLSALTFQAEFCIALPVFVALLIATSNLCWLWSEKKKVAVSYCKTTRALAAEHLGAAPTRRLLL